MGLELKDWKKQRTKLLLAEFQRGEQNFICQKLGHEQQKWRQRFKITPFSPGPEGKSNSHKQSAISAEGQNQNLDFLYCREVHSA